MIPFTTLVFPKTIPSSHQLTSLLTLFEPVVYYRPVENDSCKTDTKEKNTLLTDTNLCRLDTPVPLGEHQERFKRLLDDLVNRRDDYAAQLSQLTLAALSSRSSKEPETKDSILSQLLNSQGIVDKKEEHKQLLLWQARLVLKLAEIVGTEQQLLQNEMKSITQKEQSLFASIRDDDMENPFESDNSLLEKPILSKNFSELQLKAWSRLFAARDVQADCPILTTDDHDAMGRLAEEHAAKTGNQPLELFSISLPGEAQDVPVDTYLAQRKEFRAEGKEIIDQLFTLLDRARTVPISDESFHLPQKVKNSWNTLLQACFPGKIYNRQRLTFFLFKEVSATELFLSSFGRDDDENYLASPLDTSENTLIGLLEK